MERWEPNQSSLQHLNLTSEVLSLVDEVMWEAESVHKASGLASRSYKPSDTFKMVKAKRVTNNKVISQWGRTGSVADDQPKFSPLIDHLSRQKKHTPSHITVLGHLMESGWTKTK